MQALSKQIGPVQGVALLITALLGTAVFAVPAMSVTLAGEQAPIAWLLTLALVIPMALTFALLGRHYPHSGGTSHYLGRAFGTTAENFAAWLFVSILPTGLPPAIYFASSYLQQLFPAETISANQLSYFILAAMFCLALLGVKASAYLQTAIAIISCSVFVATLLFTDWQGFEVSLPPISAWSIDSITAAMAVVFWAFVGIEAVAHLGGEFKNPNVITLYQSSLV